MKAYFDNPLGFDLKPTEQDGYFLFTLNLDSPLTYHDGNGGKLQPNRRYKTDLGSIPKVLQVFVAPDKYKLAFLFHDSVWDHGGIWYCAPGYEEYSFVPISRRASNRRLRDMIIAEAAMHEDITPDEARRDAAHIKLGTDIGAVWAFLTRRRPRYER